MATTAAHQLVSELGVVTPVGKRSELTSLNTTATAINIAANATSGGITLKAGTAGITATAVTGPVTVRTSAAGGAEVSATVGPLKLKGTGGLTTPIGVVTQTGAVTNGVTMTGPAATIATVSSTLAAGGAFTFTVTNALVTTTTLVNLTLDYSGVNGTPLAFVANVAAGSFDVRVANVHASAALNAALRLHVLLFNHSA
jgi:hypothetical protein